MDHPPGNLAAHPLPPGIVGALGLGGYQLLVDVAGVGAGRLGPQAFLLIAPDPDPALPDAGTQISLHHSRLKDDAELAPFTQLAAQLGYLRLSGYRLALERHGLRSKVNVVNPATGGIVASIPDNIPVACCRPSAVAGSTPPPAGSGGLAAAGRAAPGPAEPRAAARGPAGAGVPRRERGRRRGGRAGRPRAELARGDHALDPPAALEAAKKEG